MAEGVYGAVEAKDCRIDKSKQLVTEGYVLADRLFQVFQLDIRIIQFCDQADGRQAAYWDTPSFHQLGTTEKISLEVVEVQRSALLKLLSGFDFLGDQLNRVLSDGLNGRLQCRPPVVIRSNFTKSATSTNVSSSVHIKSSSAIR